MGLFKFLKRVEKAVDRLAFGKERRQLQYKEKRKRQRRNANTGRFVKKSYSQDELRDLVRLGQAQVKPHRK